MRKTPIKKDTYANKLAALLGIDETIVKKSGYDSSNKKSKKNGKSNNNIVGISEDELQSFRAAQGIVYFLQAPELFSSKICPHCGEGFLVSRQYVAFCSYTCIKKDLESKGLGWSKGDDIESLVTTVFEGNEPLWIREPMLTRLRAVLSVTPSESLLSQASTSEQERSLVPTGT